MKRLEKRKKKKRERKAVGDMSIKEQIAEYNPDAIIFDDLDDAIIGVGQQHGSHTVAIYDRQKCIDIFANNFMIEKKEQLKRELNDHEVYEAYNDAIEWFEYNVECLYAGESTPIIIESF